MEEIKKYKDLELSFYNKYPNGEIKREKGKIFVRFDSNSKMYGYKSSISELAKKLNLELIKNTKIDQKVFLVCIDRKSSCIDRNYYLDTFVKVIVEKRTAKIYHKDGNIEKCTIRKGSRYEAQRIIDVTVCGKKEIFTLAMNGLESGAKEVGVWGEWYSENEIEKLTNILESF